MMTLAKHTEFFWHNAITRIGKTTAVSSDRFAPLSGLIPFSVNNTNLHEVEAELKFGSPELRNWLGSMYFRYALVSSRESSPTDAASTGSLFSSEQKTLKRAISCEGWGDTAGKDLRGTPGQSNGTDIIEGQAMGTICHLRTLAFVDLRGSPLFALVCEEAKCRDQAWWWIV